MSSPTFRVLENISEVSASAWDDLLDPNATPFVKWAWLASMEKSGCANSRADWVPRHLTLWRDSHLVAAAPAYVRRGSDGDFSRDWDWASATQRAGLRYYPKLAVTVPFTPATGRRFLVGAGGDRAASIAALVQGAMELARKERIGSIQVLFPDAKEASELEGAGMARRVSFQYHWRNAGYRTTDDFLARFSSKRRTMIKRESAAPAAQGITIHTLRGEELAADAARAARDAYGLHRSTVEKMMWGRGWLNQGFYERVFAAMPQHLELVEARRDGKLIAGAFNVASETHLYGRYWGCFEEHPFLHFNVCYYHSVDECIRRGIQVFEGGAGGEHKLPRGFEPAETYSTHLFLDAKLDRAIRQHLAIETEERTLMLEQWRKTRPILKPLVDSSVVSPARPPQA